MPGGLVNNVVNFTSDFAMTKPHYFIIVIVAIILILIYSQRALNVSSDKYEIFVTLLIIFLMSIIILATFMHVLKISDPNGYAESFSNIFNSTGGRNFLVIITLVLFVVYMCEIPEYGNNDPYSKLEILGDYNFLSTRTVGIIIIFAVTLFTAYTIMITTNESQK